MANTDPQFMVFLATAGGAVIGTMWHLHCNEPLFNWLYADDKISKTTENWRKIAVCSLTGVVITLILVMVGASPTTVRQALFAGLFGVQFIHSGDFKKLARG